MLIYVLNVWKIDTIAVFLSIFFQICIIYFVLSPFYGIIFLGKKITLRGDKMIEKKILTIGLSTLLLGTTLLAQGTTTCVGGVCIVNLDNLKPSKSYIEKRKPLVVLAQPRYITNKKEVRVENNDVFIAMENKVDKTIDIIVDNEEIYVFPSYVMTEAEKAIYIQEQEAIALNEKFNKEENRKSLIVMHSVEETEDRILEKTTLPTSDYYCEKNKQPVYNLASDELECV